MLEGRAMGTLAVVSLLAAVTPAASGATLEAWPGNDIESIADGMSAGDTLVLHGGTYNITCLRVYSKNGSSSNWTTIAAADGESPVLRGSTSENGIDILNCSYLRIQGLDVCHADEGIKFNSTGSCHDVVLEDLKVHEIDAVGISGPGAGNRNITVRRCEVYDTGRAATTGEGIYISYFDKEVKYLTIESCWIHDLGGSQSDGIDIKLGRGCLIRDNVIHGCSYPAIIVRGSGDALAPNIVERNVVWAANAGIETYGDCAARNNVVFGCSIGIYSRDDASYPLRNVSFINNTVYDCNPCLDLHDWGGKSGMVVANNALYRASSGERAVYVNGGLGGVTVTDNIYHGTLYLNGAPSTGLAAGGSPTADMLAPSSRDFYPTAAGALLDAANGAYAPAGDFNGTARPFGSGDDAGAYEWTQADNPGWQIGSGFKAETPPPDGNGGGGDRGCGAGGGAFAGAFLFLFASGLRRGSDARP